MKRKVLAGIIPAMLILLFAYTATNKLADLGDFTKSMYNQPIPHPLAYALARIIPVAELLAAGCLLFAKTQRLGLYTSFILLGIFTGYIALILMHVFRKIPCSCAGIFRHTTWIQHLWINIFLLALTGLALFPQLVNRFHFSFFKPLKQSL